VETYSRRFSHKDSQVSRRNHRKTPPARGGRCAALHTGKFRVPGPAVTLRAQPAAQLG